MSKGKPVTFRFNARTMADLDFLHQATGIENRTEITENSIALTTEIARMVQNGGRLVVQEPSGTKYYPHFVDPVLKILNTKE